MVPLFFADARRISSIGQRRVISSRAFILHSVTNAVASLEVDVRSHESGFFARGLCTPLRQTVGDDERLRNKQCIVLGGD